MVNSFCMLPIRPLFSLETFEKEEKEEKEPIEAEWKEENPTVLYYPLENGYFSWV